MRNDMNEDNKTEFTETELVMLKYAFKNLYSIAECIADLVGYAFDVNDVWHLAEKLGIDDLIL